MNSSHRELLTDRVYDHLLQRFARKHLPLGTRLYPGRLATELSVSRFTVNKALAKLERKGWIRSDAAGHPILRNYPTGKPQPVAPAEFRFTNQTDSIYEAMLDQILRGKWQPGEELKETRVAQLLKVNPATVRRAAEWLSNEGLLTRMPRRGWKVSLIDDADIQDIYRIRMALEPLYVSSAIRQISPETLDRLESESNELIRLGEKATVYQRRQADYNFHRTLAEASGSRTVCQTLEPLIRKTLLVTAVSFRFARTRQTYEEHNRILAGFRRNDEDEAIEQLKVHLHNAAQSNKSIFGPR